VSEKNDVDEEIIHCISNEFLFLRFRGGYNMSAEAYVSEPLQTLRPGNDRVNIDSFIMERQHGRRFSRVNKR